MIKCGLSFNIVKKIIVVVFVAGSMTAKTQVVPMFDPLKDDIIEKIQPLSALIDSALKHDPYVRFRDLQIVANRCKLNAEQSYWLRNFGVQSDVRYGTFNNFSTNTAEGQNPDYLATQTSQWNWGVGAYVKFPLIDLVTRKSQVNLAETEIEQAVSMAQVQKNEVRQLVIQHYNNLVLKKTSLK